MQDERTSPFLIRRMQTVLVCGLHGKQQHNHSTSTGGDKTSLLSFRCPKIRENWKVRLKPTLARNRERGRTRKTSLWNTMGRRGSRMNLEPVSQPEASKANRGSRLPTGDSQSACFSPRMHYASCGPHNTLARGGRNKKAVCVFFFFLLKLPVVR